LNIVYANIPESEIYDLRFLEALKKEYANIYVVFFDNKKTKTFIPSGVKTIRLRDPPLLPFSLNLRLADKKIETGWVLKTLLRGLFFRMCIKKLKPDLLIGQYLTHYAFYGALSGFHPFLAGAWGSDVLVEPKKSRIYRLLARYSLMKADTLMCSAWVLKHELMKLGYDSRKIWVFPWGIDLRKFKPLSTGSEIKEKLGWNGNHIVISTRNHSQVYGIEYLIMAIPIIMEKVPSARFLIVGYGILTEKLKEMTKKLEIEHFVSFPGKVQNDELPRYLSISEVYVSTSYSDGTSASLLESMACGLPSVVTDIPANREWIQDRVNGFLVPPRDSKTLADKIVYLLNNEKIRKNMGERNIELSKAKADWEKNVKIFYSAIEASLKTKIAD
jgi:L-malate glycosyltransferase